MSDYKTTTYTSFKTLKGHYIAEKTMHKSWRDLFPTFLKSQYFDNIITLIYNLYQNSGLTLEPQSPGDIFAAYDYIKPEEVRVVILGGEPPKDSNGLLFGTDTDESNALLDKHITRFFSSDSAEFDASLLDWCDKGVMSLNTNLVAVDGHPRKYHQAFKYLIRHTMSALYKLHGDKLIVACINPLDLPMLRSIGYKEANIVIGDGYFNIKHNINVSIYEGVNDILKNRNEKEIKFSSSGI